MIQWLKTLSGSICIVTILMHLIPDGRFAKYVRFYAGLLLFLIMLQPVLEFLGDGNELDHYLQLEFLREEYYDLESAAEGLSDLKNDQILTAYQSEISRQVSEIASAYGLDAISVEIEFGEDGYSIETISLTVEATGGEEAAEITEPEITEVAAMTRDEIAGLYLIPTARISIIWL
ncbi:MAG: stage III sporulation protein AF [Lachnospiraceae bacterium]|nr:stage III sporulation protein AF [Lachnospiraceae bacterium]